MSKFAENLRYYRKAQKLTQLALGEKINAGYTMISMLESEKWTPDIATIKALAEVLEVSIEDLFKDSY